MILYDKFMPDFCNALDAVPPSPLKLAKKAIF